MSTATETTDDAAGPPEPGAAPPEPAPSDRDGQTSLPDMGELEPTSPPLIDDQGRVRLSFSRIESYTNCPAKFRYAYIDRIPGQPSPSLSFGTSIHSVLERFYKQPVQKPPSVEKMLGWLKEEWESEGFEGVSRTFQLEWYEHARDVLARFHFREAPNYRLPAATEQWFDLPVDDVAVVVGSIDRVAADDHGALEVIDYKTNKRAKTVEQVRNSLQLAIYAMACEHLYGQLPRFVTLYFVVPGIPVRVPIEDVDLDRARRVIIETAERVRAEAYDPTPTRLCDWCDYRASCPAWEGEGPEVLGEAERQLVTLRRRIKRDVRAMRELEAGVERLRERVRRSEEDPAS